MKLSKRKDGRLMILTYYLYKRGEGKIFCDGKKDAQFTHWCLTH